MAAPSTAAAHTVEAPTQAEALSAYRKAYAASPLAWDRENLPEITLALGQCDKGEVWSGRRLHDLSQDGPSGAAP